MVRLPGAKDSVKKEYTAKTTLIPDECGIEIRKNPGLLEEMIEDPSERPPLMKEALARQYVLLIDRSTSMFGEGWKEAERVVEKLIPTMFELDVDNRVPMYFFGCNSEFIGECTSVDEVKRVFREASPNGTTNLSAALHEAIETYAGKRRDNFDVVPGTTFVVILDGGANNRQAVKDILKKVANPANGYIDNHTQVAVSFVQVLNDPGARRFLQDLDDNIEPLDIVDTKHADWVHVHGAYELLEQAIFD